MIARSHSRVIVQNLNIVHLKGTSVQNVGKSLCSNKTKQNNTILCNQYLVSSESRLGNGYF